MEANYLYHHQQQQQQPPAASSSFYVDPFNYLPNSPIEIPLFLHHQNGELVNNDNTNASSSFTISYQHSEEAVEETPTSSDLDVVVPLPTPQSQSPSLEKKRKKGVGICLTSIQSKGGKESKGRRKISNSVVNGEVEKKKSKLANKELKDTKASINHNEEPASGYIHVRARGGQATDSHSLAERVRRERISERMKKLQGLVPGCDNVIGKALVLDEIINYVQSLQNQVEFLSMKLASVHPILYGFGLEDYMVQVPEEMGSISQAMPSLIQTSHTSLTAFEAAAATHSLQQQMIDHPPPPFPLHPHGPTSFPQGSENFLVQVGDQIRGFELNNMSSFQ